MFNSIIVAFDLASSARRALPVARSLAGLGNLPIELMTVSPPPRPLEEMDTYELERLAGESCMSPRCCVIEHDDDAGLAIARHVNNSEGSLLVLATSATAPGRRHFLGTLTESVLARVDKPVLLVGPNVPATCRLNTPTLVACVDSTDTADAALPVVADWVRTFGGGRPCCAEVIATAAGDWSDVRAASRLRDYAVRLTEYRIDASWKVLHGGDPMAWLEEFAETVNEAVLVVSSADWTDWDTHWHSAIRCLLHTTARPVLVVPPRRVAIRSSDGSQTVLVGAAQ
jgi:nucleotide-binding universal stress UspA family protein